MSGNDENLEQFITVTGIDEERARFYMESSAWQLEVALASFYENDGDAEPLPPEIIDQGPEESPPIETANSMGPPTAQSRQKSRFATIHTLNSSSEDDEEQGQAFYAGGSEHSGQQVLGPPKKRDIVSDMFKSVQEHGVEVLDPATGSSSKKVFKGTGYKLGQSGSDSEAIPGAAEPTPPALVTLKLWQDGFSLDNGELRPYTDPSNREFLDSVRRGEIPNELRQGSTEVHLSMEDHRMESFNVEGEKKHTRPFSGTGHTLGSPAPATVGAPMPEDNAVNEAHAREVLAVDRAQPTTNLQIRLADGSRLLGQFNHGHTLGQVRSFIVTARPQYETRPFVLLSSYPSRELQDAQTIAEAGILNSAIMQKLK